MKGGLSLSWQVSEDAAETQLTLSGDRRQNHQPTVRMTEASTSDGTVCKVKSWLSPISELSESGRGSASV